MLGYNAIATNAVGMAGTSASSPINLSCSIASVAALSATLTSRIALVAAIGATTTITANLTAPVAPMMADLSSTSALVGTLTTRVNLSTLVASSANIVANLTTVPAVPAFTPSAARTISVLSTSPAFTGSKWWNLADAKKPRGLKDPDATIDITFDWSDWLNDIGAVTISEVTFTLKGGMNSVSTHYSSTKATVFVSGGVVGTTSTVSCKIKTNTTPPRTDERTVYIDIGDE